VRKGSKPATSPPPAETSPRTRKTVPGKEQVSIYLTAAVAERLRIAAVKERRRVSDLAEELIVFGLDQRPKT
jgi:hypothetical protein